MLVDVDLLVAPFELAGVEPADGELEVLVALAGGAVGLDVAVNLGRRTAVDAGACGALLGQFVWRAGGRDCGAPYCDVATDE